MNPVDVFGAGLVRSSRIRVVLTGSNVIVVGCAEAVANCVCCPVTGAQPVPVQYDTATLLGSARLELIVKYGTTELSRCAFGQLTDTHSFGCATLTAGSTLVA